MEISETRQEFHKLIDSVNNERILKSFFKLFNEQIQRSQGTLWKSLTKEEQEELLFSYDESFDEVNLIDHIEVKNRFLK